MTGLRERKRQALRSNIERAAVDLVLEHGYDRVTVDMICAAADASQRTFFNYFGSKEAAVLGPPPPELDPARVEEFVERPQADTLTDLVRLMTRALATEQPDPHLWNARREIIQGTPALMRAQVARITAKDEELVGLVLRRFRAGGRSEPGLADEARMVVSLWAGFAWYTIGRWSVAEGSAPQPELEAGVAVLDRTLANLGIARDQ
jgi:AcrR family transcriptional regulator